MDCTAQHLSYDSTGFFSPIVIDYLNAQEELQPFYAHRVSLEGIKEAIAARKKYPTDRKLLAEILRKQYADEKISAKQEANIKQLMNENCFTITTAHQPNIFTGHLYFIYKILHAVKLAEELKHQLPGNDFVPVFYMGSEDADLDELGHIYINGNKHEWKTNQTGAVGRMKVDKALVKLIDEIAGEITVYPFGAEIIDKMKTWYIEGSTIEQATFKMINSLFREYGLIVLLPDNAELKRAFIPVAEKELEEIFSHKLVEETALSFPKKYKLQASGRELNLFYLDENSRERILFDNSTFSIQHSTATFNNVEIKKALQEHPERFSPNVILRPVYQEMILPNIIFIGGGGELAYWLELKKIFEAVQVPFPVMVLRNSFLVLNKEQAALMAKLRLSHKDLFKSEDLLLNELVEKDSTVQLNLDHEKLQLTALYDELKELAAKVDNSLINHTDALKTQALRKLTALEKKMLRAEKRKFEAQQRQLHKLKEQLFPHNSLQERVENFMLFYAKWGKEFIEAIYKNSLALEQEFVILEEGQEFKI